jgi:competence protein ComEC
MLQLLLGDYMAPAGLISIDVEENEGAILPKSVLASWSDAAEKWLFEERDVLPLWSPVGIAGGIICWQEFGDAGLAPIILFCGLLMGAGLFLGRGLLWGRILMIAGIFILLGFAAIMGKSAMVSAPILEKMQITEFYARIVTVEHLPAQEKTRLELETAGHAGLPAKIRINLSPKQDRPEFREGAIIRLRARLVPPAPPTLPGSYDFARRAWFSGLGATGSALGEVTLYRAGPETGLFGDVRSRLAGHIAEQLPGSAGSIAITMVTGERGSISVDDEAAMRNSGMAHLLSISGLHVTAVVGAIFMLFSRILALFPRIALRFPVPVMAACAAALGAIGYTLLTGAQVPTIRSCIAALMILVALALGRDALSLRLVAFGAGIILLFWPESLAGPSFQLSFAAVTTIIMLHSTPWVKGLSAAGGGNIIWRVGRSIFLLLFTGFAIELVLTPIAIFHFHRAGIYGAFANVIAIPLTTFIIMPFEALALIFDIVGIGAPFWWVAGQSISFMLALAHYISAMPGAVTAMPAIPNWAFGAIILGALWVGIFQSAMRWAGLLPFVAGLIGMWAAPYPDLLITGDGKHLAVVDGNGKFALLRSRAGDYVRETLQENAGTREEPINIEDLPGARCSADSCVVSLNRGGRMWTLLAIRTRYPIPAMELAAACKRADIVVSDRWLPYSCKPRWIKADRDRLAKTGGLAFYLKNQELRTVSEQSPHAPWVIMAREAAQKAERQHYQKYLKSRDDAEIGPTVTSRPAVSERAASGLPN